MSRENYDYLNVLLGELEQRRKKNPAYSLRSFARAIDIDPGTVSRVLNGKQIPTYDLASRIAARLNLTQDQESAFFRSASCAYEKKSKAKTVGSWNGIEASKVKDLDVTFYEVISDWYHMAIMEMTFLANFNLKPELISERLGITQNEAEDALQRLLALGLIEVRDNKLVKKDKNLSTAQKNITTQALKKNQRQFLSKAIESLENTPIERRTVTSMTMAIDPRLLETAKKMIHDFNQSLCRFLEQGSRTRIYNLSVALNPIDIEDV